MITNFALVGLHGVMGSSGGRGSSRTGESSETISDGIVDVLMTGVAIIVPLIITLYLFQVALNFVSKALDPFIRLLGWMGVIERVESVALITFLIDVGVYPLVIDFLTELIAIAVLFGIVVLVGTVGRNRYGERVISTVDLAIASVPGVGTIYKSFRRMGDVMLDNEAENFQDVKLVECFGQDIYVIGFETSPSPATVEESTGHDEMKTMFLPLAPNPVTGGLLTHVPRDQVYDVDMTIEEGVRSILTSGVASGEGGDQRTELSMGDLDSITDIDLQNAITVEPDRDPGAGPEPRASEGDDGPKGDRG
jgi:uncharacterized membrane protein